MLPPPPASAPSALDNPRAEDHGRPPKPLVMPPSPVNMHFPASSSPIIQLSPSSSLHDPSSNYNTGSGTSELRPLTFPRKSSLVESVSSGPSTSTGTGSHFPPSITYESPIPQVVTTPASSPNPAQIVTNKATPNGMLSTIVEGPRPHMLSRESRVSLPDEAKQYIANMADSPVASPRADAFAAKFGAASRSHPEIQIPDGVDGVGTPGAIGEEDSPGGTKEFLDMRHEDDQDEDEGGGEEDEEDNEDEEGDDGDDGDSAIMVSEADADSEVLPDSSVRESLGSQLQEHELQQPVELQGRLHHPDGDEFPPPLSAHLPRQQAMIQSHIQQHQPTHENLPSQGQHPNPDARHQRLHPAQPPHPSSDRLENPYSPPGQHQQHQQPLRMDSHYPYNQPGQAVPASFRALPLLSSDLPHTTITVSHSFVRPNDRGKEVLSFVVHVDPGKGKEGWKVEKMYSDVLGLDQRVRSSVAKGIGKKIASLPEGKLWKDHAPAKVDQRKVLATFLFSSIVRTIMFYF